jgi:ketosteroid isomerase-like protein
MFLAMTTGGKAMNASEKEIVELGQRWAEAEVRGDVAALDALATDDFRLVGPAGFILDKQQWLERYRAGALVTRSLRWEDVDVRVHGDTAIAIGRDTQEAEFQGNAVNGEFRATQVAVREAGRWRLASVHIGPLGAPPPFLRQGPPAGSGGAR